MRSAIELFGCRRSRHGITLVEVLIAMVLLALSMAALAPVLSSSALLRRQQELIAEATNLGQLEIEEIRRSWSVLENRGQGARQSQGGLVPTNMRDRLIPMPQPCVLSALDFEGCKSDPPQPPGPLPLPASEYYPFPEDGFEVVSPDPTGNGPADLYLYDPTQEPPTSGRFATFTMRGVRGPQTYRVQVFWGYAPGSPTPEKALADPEWYRNEVVRVVVRIYLAGKDGELPRDSSGKPTRLTQPVRPVISSKAESLTDTDARTNDPNRPPVFSPLAPLVVLTTDIARSYN